MPISFLVEISCELCPRTVMIAVKDATEVSLPDGWVPTSPHQRDYVPLGPISQGDLDIKLVCDECVEGILSYKLAEKDAGECCIGKG